VIEIVFRLEQFMSRDVKHSSLALIDD